MSLLPIARRLFAEFVGTLLLLTAVIGSGIMAERLSGGNAAVALLANTIATVCALFVLIEALGPISGAHFNPVVTALYARATGLRPCEALMYIGAQLAGGIAGAVLANLMFDLSPLHWSTKVRGGTGQWIAEVVATAGLVLVIARASASRASMMVAAYIGAAYWFTSSTSFANPAAVLGRMFSDTFAGISPTSSARFLMAEAIGGAIGWFVAHALRPLANTPPDCGDA